MSICNAMKGSSAINSNEAKHTMRGFSNTVTVFCLALAVAGIGATAHVFAHSGAKGIVKERMELMKGMGDAMKVMGAMFKGEAPFEPSVVAEKAAYLADHAKHIPDMTPEGTNDHPSEALPVIWLEWDDYVADADKLAEAGKKLVDIAGNGADLEATRAAFIGVSKTCGSCHDRFRKPKE